VQHTSSSRSSFSQAPRKVPTSEQINRTKFPAGRVEELEEWMEEMISCLPDITSFVLPCGDEVASSLHMCRTVCRRAERRVIPLVNGKLSEPEVLKFLNRLSDYLFVLARYTCMIQGVEEIQYASSSKKQRAVLRRRLRTSTHGEDKEAAAAKSAAKKSAAKKEDSRSPCTRWLAHCGGGGGGGGDGESREDLIRAAQSLMTHGTVALLAFLLGSWAQATASS